MQNLMFRMEETPGSIRWPAAASPGQPEVFAELGFDEQELAALRDKGVI